MAAFADEKSLCDPLSAFLDKLSLPDGKAEEYSNKLRSNGVSSLECLREGVLSGEITKSDLKDVGIDRLMDRIKIFRAFEDSDGGNNSMGGGGAAVDSIMDANNAIETVDDTAEDATENIPRLHFAQFAQLLLEHIPETILRPLFTHLWTQRYPDLPPWNKNIRESGDVFVFGPKELYAHACDLAHITHNQPKVLTGSQDLRASVFKGARILIKLTEEDSSASSAEYAVWVDKDKSVNKNYFVLKERFTPPGDNFLKGRTKHAVQIMARDRVCFDTNTPNRGGLSSKDARAKALSGDITQWDTTLLCFALQNSYHRLSQLCPSDLRDFLHQYRQLRNVEWGHTDKAKMSATDYERYEQFFKDFAKAVDGILPDTSKRLEEHLQNGIKENVSDAMMDKYIEQLKTWQKCDAIRGELRDGFYELSKALSDPLVAVVHDLQRRFDSLIEMHMEDFVGRDWLFTTIQEWVYDNATTRLALVLGDPGAGKSAVMSSLVSQSEYDLIAYYFCDAKQNTESLRASNFVNYVIVSLAGREDIPYRYRLLEKAHKSSLPEVLVFLKGKASEGVSPSIIFAEYVLEILSGLPAPPSEGGFKFLLIDSLDEALLCDSGCKITTLLAQALDHKQWPSWLRVIASSRREDNVLKQYPSRLKQDTQIDAKSDENQRDVKRFIVRKLRHHFDILYGARGMHAEYKLSIHDQHVVRSIRVLTREIGCDGYSHKVTVLDNILSFVASAKEKKAVLPILAQSLWWWIGLDKDGVASAICDKSDGNFQYAKLVLESVFAGTIHTKEALLGMPTGLPELYLARFTQQFPDTTKYGRDIAPLLEIILASAEPLSADDLAYYVLERPPQSDREMRSYVTQPLQLLNVYLHTSPSNNCVSVYHQSFADWITLEDGSSSNGEYGCSLRDGHRKLFELGNGANPPPEIYEYFIKHGIRHACAAGAFDAARNLLLSFAWLLKKVTKVGPYEAVQDCAHYLQHLQKCGRKDRPVYLIKHALQLSLSALYKDSRELASQFVGGRLSMRYDEKQHPEILKVVEQAKQYCPSDGDGARVPVWMPTTRLLTPAGHPLLTVLEGHTGPVISVCWSGDGSNRICSGSWDKTVRVWDAESGQCLTVLEGHTGEVMSVCWSGDGSNRICSGSRDNTVRVWDAESGQCLTVLEGHTNYVYSVCWSGDGSNRICSGSTDNTMRVWDAESGQCLTVLEGHTDWVRSVCWSGDGSNRICSGSHDNTVRVWDAKSGQCLTVLEGHTDDVTSVCWSGDGLNRICSGSRDKTVRVWDAESGQCLTVLEGHTSYVTSVCWSGDGSNRICSGSYDNTVRVWDAESGQCLTVLEGHTGTVTSVCWSGDGSNRICSGSWDNTVRVWDAESGQCLTVLEGHTEPVRSVCWSGDGSNRICSGSYDKTVRVWDAESGQCLTEDHQHDMTEEFKGEIEQPFACRTGNTVGYSIDGNTSPKAYFVFDKDDQAVRACVRDDKCLHILKLVK